MKKLIFFLFFFLLITSITKYVYSQSRWNYIFKDSYNQYIYYDSYTIEYSNNSVYVWCMWNVGNIEDNQENGFAEKYRINCLKRSILKLGSTFFKHGKPEDSWATDLAEEFYSIPGDVWEKIINTVCK